MVFALATSVHLLMILGETTLTHATAHARLGVRELTRGRYARVFWAGIVLGALGLASPWLPILGSGLGLLGLLAYEHAYVQAGQSVPIA
jgi:hypothetical protein